MKEKYIYWILGAVTLYVAYTYFNNNSSTSTAAAS